mmetsp:Transcript_57361/g.134283  ORF Transcript_57361/g.134283 Transcript_57361/m.134283 type:complete len:261 (-) Transcript_57361:1766-2548(-)
MTTLTTLLGGAMHKEPHSRSVRTNSPRPQAHPGQRLGIGLPGVEMGSPPCPGTGDPAPRMLLVRRTLRWEEVGRHSLNLQHKANPPGTTLKKLLLPLDFSDVLVAESRLFQIRLRFGCGMHRSREILLHGKSSHSLQLSVHQAEEIRLTGCGTSVPLIIMSQEGAELVEALFVKLPKVAPQRVMPVIRRATELHEPHMPTGLIWVGVPPKLFHINHHGHSLVECHLSGFDVLLGDIRLQLFAFGKKKGNSDLPSQLRTQL